MQISQLSCDANIFVRNSAVTCKHNYICSQISQLSHERKYICAKFCGSSKMQLNLCANFTIVSWMQLYLRAFPQYFANAILFARNSSVPRKHNYICAQFHSNLKTHLYLRTIPQHLANAMIIAPDCTLTRKCNITQNMDVISNPCRRNLKTCSNAAIL